jgi:hypothetical protein
MGVDVADAAAEQFFTIDEPGHLLVRGDDCLRGHAERRPLSQIAERKFARNKPVPENIAAVEQGGEPFIVGSQMIDPNRSVDQDHWRFNRRRLARLLENGRAGEARPILLSPAARFVLLVPAELGPGAKDAVAADPSLQPAVVVQDWITASSRERRNGIARDRCAGLDYSLFRGNDGWCVGGHRNFRSRSKPYPQSACLRTLDGTSSALDRDNQKIDKLTS